MVHRDCFASTLWYKQYAISFTSESHYIMHAVLYHFMQIQEQEPKTMEQSCTGHVQVRRKTGSWWNSCSKSECCTHYFYRLLALFHDLVFKLAWATLHKCSLTPVVKSQVRDHMSGKWVLLRLEMNMQYVLMASTSYLETSVISCSKGSRLHDRNLCWPYTS